VLVKEFIMEAAVRKVNECFVDAARFRQPEPLFDAHWQEGELALLTGPRGAGKSFFAVQLAEALARGREIANFHMPTSRRKVLYIDMVHSDRQFQRRYTFADEKKSGESRLNKFSDNFYRTSPASVEGFDKWLAGQIEQYGFQVVIVDDIAAFRETLAGSREIVRVMRELKKIKNETGVSILVLSGTRGRNGDDNLARQQMLSEIADSVFTIAAGANQPADRTLFQTHSRSGPLVWNSGNSPVAKIERDERGMIGLAFGIRFISEGKRELICQIKELQNDGLSFREIAEKLGMSVSTCNRLAKKWSPEIGNDDRNEDALVRLSADEEDAASDTEPEEWEEAGIKKPVWLQYERSEAAESAPESPARRGMDVSAIPFAAALRRLTVYDLKIVCDRYGRERYVEEENARGIPTIWYSLDGNKNLIRWTYNVFGYNGKHLGKTIYIPMRKIMLKSKTWRK